MKNNRITFIEERFPEDISYGSSGGPCYFTDVTTTANGSEQRNINWQHARSKYNVAYGIKEEEQFHKLVTFFRSCRGKAIGFRFKDWSDYRASNQLIGIGNGIQKTFQLTKTYENGELKTSRIITKPVAGSVKLFINGEECHALEINYTSGQIVFNEPPKIGVRILATFEFDVPVRFDTDSLYTSIEAYQIHALNDIPLIEIRI